MRSSLGVKLTIILIYSDSSGTPGAEEEGESKEDQQKVSVFWGVMPQTYCVIVHFVVVAAAPACICRKPRTAGVCLRGAHVRSFTFLCENDARSFARAFALRVYFGPCLI